jgi:hypothetical protein
VKTVLLRLAKLAAALGRGAAVHGQLGQAAIADVLDFRAVQREKPSASIAVAFRIVGQNVWAGLLAVSTATDCTDPPLTLPLALI